MQREIHLHGDRIYHAACLYMRVKFGPTTPRQKPGRSTRLVKTGTLCLYCGFNPSNLSIQPSSVVNFGKGATTGWHKHETDQILVITSGNGIVANETEELDVAVGDVVQILSGENHWHGATKDSSMGHITITGTG